MPSPLQCHGCDRFAWSALDSDRCGAFPDGIPAAIWLGDADHTQPYPGDGGVRRLPIAGSRSPERVEARHAAWGKSAVERLEHIADPLGAIVVAVDRSPLDARLDAASVEAAWRTTQDAPAMLLVLLKARRTAEIARAVRLASAQLDLEGCDYLNDNGWLGVSLTLASYQSDAALTDARAAWAALSAPFRDGYLTARVQQALLRSMRRTVPVPPSAAEWARPDEELAGIGALTEAVVAMRLAANAGLRIEDVALLEPWTAVTSPAGLEAELARELAPGHRLFGRTLRAVAKRSDRDEVLFVDAQIAAVVHLTWAKEPTPDFPHVEIFASVEEWVSRRMDADHDDFTGARPRAFAFELRSVLALEAMVEKLGAVTAWEWSIGDSAWFGKYLWARSGSTRIRVFASEEPERFTLQADRVDAEEGDDDWFVATHVVTTSIMTTIEATGIVETTPEHD